MDELIKDFLVEATEAIQKLDTELVILEQDPKNQELLGSIFRIMHTIKGTCGFLGLPRLESLAHAGENILGKIRDNEISVTPEIISIILESLDAIKFIVSDLEKNGTEPPGNNLALIKKINIAAGMETDDHHHDNKVIEEQKSPTVELAIAEKESDTSSNHKQENVSEQNHNALATQHSQEEVEALKHEAVERGLKSAEERDASNNPKQGGNNNSNQSVRVNLDILEGLMLMVSELVLTRNQLLQISRAQKDTEFSGPIQRLGHITSELQERVMKTRMQPISNAWAPFPRLVRGLANDLGKKIELKMIGEDTELDRQLIESIKDPLTHMVRNSCDHGLETGDERIKSGKSETGTVTLKAYHQGGHIIIEIADNGRGLNIAKIKEKIIKEQLATESELSIMSDQQICQYIFKAGFSTAAKITAVSGRGVGMDVVKTNIEKINGTVELRTKYGKGTNFFIKIPLTLAIMPVLIVECINEKFAIPQINVLELVRTGNGSEYIIENINQKPVLRLRNTILSLAYLSEILGLAKGNVQSDKIIDVVVCEIGGSNFGLIVDKVYDTEEIVVKPVAPILKSIDLYSGITLLGDGSVIMILDPNGIMRWISNSSNVQEASSESSAASHSSNDDKMVKFLLVKAGTKSVKAIPLELVSRLEEFDVKDIEYSGNQKIVQYRDKLMYLTKLNNEYEINKENQPVVSFVENDKILGIMVEEILDIIEHKVEIVSCLTNDSYLGSMVINDKTTDLVDISFYFEEIFGERYKDETNVQLETRALPRILLVDDSQFFRKIVPQMLFDSGYETVITENSTHALEILEKDNNFVGIVTDYHMPGMNGIDFAEFCQNDARLGNIPIIISSAVLEYKKNAKIYPNVKAYISKTNHDQLIRAVLEFFSPIKHDIKLAEV